MFKRAGNESVLEWPAGASGERCLLSVGRVLGKGGFGKCYELVSRESGCRFACKVIDKQTPQYLLTKEKVASEVGIHRRMHHPYIVRFQNYHEDDRYIYILLELCNNNTLDEVLQRRKQLTEIEVRYYMRQILDGVNYIHQQRIVHRDLKLENFFISEQMAIKIGDFGLASELPLRARRKSICGTPNYMAPQIFTSKEGYSYQVDVWSLGVIAYLLLCGRFPFEDKEPEVIAAQLRRGLLFPPRLSISAQAQSFVGRMLQPLPAQRSSIRQLLHHDFLTLFEIPPKLPLICLVCEPTLSFTSNYGPRKQQEKERGESEEQEKFEFMLQSKESPGSEGGASVQLHYQQVQSELAGQSQPIQPAPLPLNEISSFGAIYQSKRNNSCHIRQWITDFWEHPRYGLLYKTSDGILGMRFNDSSILHLTHSSRQAFLYLTSNTAKPTAISLSDISKVPKEARAKLGVMLRVTNGMEIEEGCGLNEPLFVRLYINSMSVFLLWLSNGTLQGRFRDGSQLLLGPDCCMYVDQRGKKVFPSRDFLSQPRHVQEKRILIEQVLSRASSLRREMQIEGQILSLPTGVE